MNQTADFHLPDEILSVIPTDPYDQLDLARKITSLAIASRVSKLDSETGRLRQKMNEKDRTIEEFQIKVSQLESLFQESDSRLRVTLDENAKLTMERDSLALTSKKLAGDFAKELPYEQFGAFLANIKELNAHRQSREGTLRKAEEIFGTNNKDLYLFFQGLLNRNQP